MDLSFGTETMDMYRDRAACDRFLDEWVYGVQNRREYIEHYIQKLGQGALQSIMAKLPVRPSGMVNYAYVPHLGI